MVADDLLVIPGPLSAASLHPRGEPGVQVGPHLLRQRLVGDIPDQEVAEAEAVLTDERRRVWPDEVLSNQCLEASTYARRLSLGGKVGHRSPPEHLAHHRSALQDVTVG